MINSVQIMTEETKSGRWLAWTAEAGRPMLAAAETEEDARKFIITLLTKEQENNDVQ